VGQENAESVLYLKALDLTGVVPIPVPSDCTFSLAVEVPDSDFYQIEVGHRGAVTYSESDLQSNGWTADLSIGT